MNNSLFETAKQDVEKNRRNGKTWNMVDLIKSVITVTVIMLGIYLISINKLSSKNLIVIFMYRTNVFDLVLCYTSIKEYYANYKVSASRIFSLFHETEYPKEKFGNTELLEAKGKIEIKNLSFSYGEKCVLQDLNLLIKPKDTVGIVGYSGSGKTTLFSLLTKGYDVENNKIFIDDIDINMLTKDSIRNTISVVSQDPYLFHFSIEENLKLVGENISKKDMIEACKTAQIHDDIEKLPNKYKTVIGEGGVHLSGGQKQRLAIARALLKKSTIILLDEATSALDNITQNEIQKAINTITKDYTILIIAHRLSTIKECNRIFVLEKGKIENSGTHEELLQKSPTYKNLYEKEMV